MKRIVISFIFLLSFVFSSSAQTLDPISGDWTGKLDLGAAGSLTIVLHLTQGEDGTLVCRMDSPDQASEGIPAEIVKNDGFVLEIAVKEIAMTYKGTLFNNMLAGTFSQFGQSFPLSFKRGLEKLNRPQTPSGPVPYNKEEVTFTNAAAGAVLAGTLVTPQASGTAVPVVIMVSGSGLEDRNEEIFGHKPFLVLADFLARNGVAALRYDDRCFGESKGGDVTGAITPDFRDDALAGIAFLRERGFRNIGVLGHSEGASIAFMLGASGDADFVISLAGLGVKGDIALTAQANRVFELQGADRRYEVSDYRMVAAQQHSPWLSWFIDYDPSADIAACRCPVFAVNGDRDCQVISSLNLPGIESSLPENPLNYVKEYPSLNHLFQHCTTGDVSEYRRIEETFSPEVMQDLADWIARVCSGTGR